MTQNRLPKRPRTRTATQAQAVPPAREARPDACTCGACDLASCLCGTTAGDWAAAARPRQIPGGARLQELTPELWAHYAD